jgi:hypothetical protein
MTWNFVTLYSIDKKLDQILNALGVIEKGEAQMAISLDQDIQAVADEKTVIDGAVTLLNSISAQLAAAGTDPVKLQALSDAIAANKSELAAAVAANTPAAVPPAA